MTNLLESKKVRVVLWVLGGLIILFLAFGLGMAVGYRQAGFAAGFDQNYYQNFFGTTPGAPSGGGSGMMPSAPTAMHGVVGTIIDLGTSTISVKDKDNNERAIVISSGTAIRDGGKDITIGELTIGDHIAVIGEPNDQGQIKARFIRIFSASPSMPMP